MSDLWGRFETCSGFVTRLLNRLQKPAQYQILPHVLPPESCLS